MLTMGDYIFHANVFSQAQVLAEILFLQGIVL